MPLEALDACLASPEQVRDRMLFQARERICILSDLDREIYRSRMNVMDIRAWIQRELEEAESKRALVEQEIALEGL